jgi:hypothetical protein
METQVLEGTLTEIQRRLSDLPYPPEARVRVTIEQAEPMLATKRTRNGITLVPVNKLEPETPAASRETAEPFRPTEFRNGVPLLPHREISKPLTTEFVKQLLDGEDPDTIVGPRQITDVYLLGLCQQNGGTLVTLDARITDVAIVSSHPDLICRL